MGIKQVIVMRRDLHMRRGKEMAQAAHASLKVFLDRLTPGPTERIVPDFGDDGFRKTWYNNFTPSMEQWVNWKEGQPGFIKIVVGCDSEAELYAIKEQADRAGIINALIVDNGVTEFGGVKTPTCICLGPDEVEKIDLITSKYKLL